MSEPAPRAALSSTVSVHSPFDDVKPGWAEKARAQAATEPE